MTHEAKDTQAVGALVDKLHEIRSLRLDAQKVVDSLAKRESALKTEIIQHIGEDGVVGGKSYVASVTQKEVPVIADSPAFLAWVQQSGRLDMLQKRLSSRAAADYRAETGGWPPGLDTLFVNDLSLRKR